MNKRKSLTLLNWGLAGILMLLFVAWHGAFEGPLTSEEVARYVARLQEQNPDADIDTFRRFLEDDDGRPIVMVNAVRLYDTPIDVDGQRYGDSSEEALSEYTSFVHPYLLVRGSYPLYSGTAARDAMETWGIEDAAEWSSGALMRYRSRRVILEMGTDPTFAQFHNAKIAAIEKTIAFPVTTDVSTGNLSLIAGLTLLSLALGMQLLINGRNGETHE